jgi:hypothetical protein
MIRSMPITARSQQRYDHRLRHLVPRSTARGWLGVAPTVVVSLDVADLTEPELRQEVLKLRRRVQKLTALAWSQGGTGIFASDILCRWRSNDA